MKKMVFIAAMAIVGFTSANAQEVSFGAKAGLNLAALNGDGTGDLDMRTSFHAGVMAEIGISEQFSVQPELLYSSQGAKLEMDFEEGLTATGKINLDYLNLPIMVKYYVIEGLSIEAGPQVGLLLSAKSKGESGGESVSNDIKDDLKNIDFGVNFGAGYKLDNGLNFGARYNLGLSDINDDSSEGGEGSSKIKNGVFQISVGYFF